MEVHANTKTAVYFIGIGGTAMAGAAVMARELGFSVRGADANLYPPTLNELIAANINFKTAYAVENLKPTPDMVVVGNAISRGNVELEAALAGRLNILSLPEFLARFVIRDRECFVIAGTHGKTTTTSLVAHLLRSAGIDTGYMIGGVAPDFERSASLGSASAFVIEGDEYDTSVFDPRPKFLSYRPFNALINNIEFDHADIFADLSAVKAAFARLVKIIPDNGLLVTNADNEACVALAAEARPEVIFFGCSESAHYRLLRTEPGAFSNITFSVNGITRQAEFALPGEHNALNLLAALALISRLKIDWPTLRNAIYSFKGVKRRLELRYDGARCTVIEDFAHHPTAIRNSIATLRARFPGRRLLLMIEPRSNTMVRNIFQRELAEALAQADETLIAEIYRPEKYAQSDRLNLAQLISDIEQSGSRAEKLPADDRLAYVNEHIHTGDVVCFMTNGSFGGLIDATVSMLDA